MFVGEGADSIEDILSGFVRAHPATVTVRDGAVVRRHRAPSGQVAVVLGGGGGHYPGFAGWVGAGMADAAVSGQIFSSPSEAQIYRAARSVENGSGVLLASLNYSGDRIHFGAAASRLRAECVPVEEVVIADDIASRTSRSAADGRGIAGALFVAKVLGAAADEGRSLAEVARVGRRAAARSVTLGAATSGCTLPGDREPLFTVPAGKLAIGLGIHGEPGIEMQRQGTPQELADLLVAKLLDQAPESQQEKQRVALLVNSLGGCSHEELFILYAKIHDRLESHGHVVLSPVVGEYLTSLDMVGASLSVMFLDAELESLWRAPAHTPSFFREVEPEQVQRSVAVEQAPAADLTGASLASREIASRVCGAIERAAEEVRRHEERLGQLDRVGGDGDHGRGMVRGLSAAHDAALAAAESGAGLRSVLAAAGAAWSDKAGGTSGALWGAALAAFATAVDDQRVPTVADIADGLLRALDAVGDLGGAHAGDKTMVDAIAPFVEVFTNATGAALASRWAQAVSAAEEAAEGTADLVAAKGRARLHRRNTLGTPDPGAMSFALVTRAVAASFDE